jgi:hypothetical protein
MQPKTVLSEGKVRLLHELNRSEVSMSLFFESDVEVKEAAPFQKVPPLTIIKEKLNSKDQSK